MSWFHKKIKPEINPNEIENLASKLTNAKMESTWLGRKVVVGGEDLTRAVKVTLKAIKTNLNSLEGNARTHAVTLVTKLDTLYNTADKVRWFNPTGKTAKSLKQKLEKQENTADRHVRTGGSTA